MPVTEFLSLLGLARKAGKVALGYEKALDAIHRGRACAVFVAGDLSLKTERGLRFALEAQGKKPYRLRASMQEMSDAVGTKTGVAAIMDAGFAKRLTQLADFASDSER